MRLSLLLWLSAVTVLAQPFEGYAPPGTVFFSGNLFIDIIEVSNGQWQEFEIYARNDSSDRYVKAIIPASEVTKRYRPNYYRNPFLKNFPVVGVNQIQAEEFCKWRTRFVNEKIRILVQNNALSINVRVKYRLPTELEWMLIAQKTDTLKFTKPRKYQIERLIEEKDLASIQNLLKDPNITLRKVKVALKNHVENDSIPYYKLDYKRPSFGTIADQLPESVFFPDRISRPSYSEPINMMGNVAEMVKEPGITKGGSWRHQLPVSFPHKKIVVNPTNFYDWVGFRCICEVYYVE